MNISDNIIKHHLKNVYFITGTAYAGKSTMCKMIAEKYGLFHWYENYKLDVLLSIVDEKEQPNLSYFKTKKDWQEYLNRSPEEYAKWILGNSEESASFEITELIKISSNQKVIVDTNIPLEYLKRISSYNNVAVMLSPQSISVDYFFEREDEEKQFLLSKINKCKYPEKTLLNFKACLAKINSCKIYNEFLDSGFYTLIRENVNVDTRSETINKLANHFGFNQRIIKLQPNDEFWQKTIAFALKCSWNAVGKHLADAMKRNSFTDFESVFACIINGEIAGYCTFLKSDYYPKNRYSPWISTIFVDEKHRGKRISHQMIETVIKYAKENGFQKVYIPSDMNGFYEKCGFTPIDTLINYGGDTDTIFMREI